MDDITFQGRTLNGFAMLLLDLIIIALSITGLAIAGSCGDSIMSGGTFAAICAICIIFLIIGTIIPFGLMTVEPNQARAMVFFGKYRGTFTKTGFSWVNPFYAKKKISLRARNINIDPIKVNDRNGNPVLVGLILVWKVSNVYKAIFEIDTQTMAAAISSSHKAGKEEATAVISGSAGRMAALESFVRIQSDAALRQVAGNYAYECLGSGGQECVSLRNGGDTVNRELEQRLGERLEMAGITVIEARIN